MILAFVRHGQTDWNRDRRAQGISDIPLNDTGRAQAKAAVQGIAVRAWDAVVSSPLSRARESAQIIAEGLAVGLYGSYLELRERDYGPHEGSSDIELIRQYPDHLYPGAEEPGALVRRVLVGIARIEQDFPAKSVVVVCHGTVIWYTLNHLLGETLDYVPNGGFLTIQGAGENWKLIT